MQTVTWLRLITSLWTHVRARTTALDSLGFLTQTIKGTVSRLSGLLLLCSAPTRCWHESNTKRTRWAERCPQSLSRRAHRSASRRQNRTWCDRTAHQPAQGCLPTSGTAPDLVHYPSEHFQPPREYAGLGVSFRPSKRLCTCQLLLYHI